MAKLKESVSKGFAAINIKTNSFVATNKLNTYISTLESEIKELKLELGQAAYTQWSGDETINLDDLKHLCEQIKEKEELIEKQHEEIKAIEQQEQNILGKKDNASIPKENIIFCSECGCENDKAYKFCRKCGKPL